MSKLHTRTSIQHSRAQDILSEILEHLGEEELQAQRHENQWELDYDGALIRFWTQDDQLHSSVSANSTEAFFDARMLIIHHLEELAGCHEDDLHWEGDTIKLERPPAFRILTVSGVTPLNRSMVRIRFQSHDLERYNRAEDLHCKLFIPKLGVKHPEWPTVSEHGTPQLPTGDKALDIRTYTLREVNAAAGWLDIDFVLHDDAGPGSAWAAQAQIGQQIGISGPGGRSPTPAAWMLLAGDETALPAIARTLEHLPPHTQGLALIEVQGPEDELPLKGPEQLTIQWLHRGASAPGTSQALLEAIRSCAIPETDSRHVWIGAEFSTAQAARLWLRDTVGLQRHEQLVVAYWRHGMDETRMKSGGRRAVAEAPPAQRQE